MNAELGNEAVAVGTAVFLASAGLSWFARRYALLHSLLDVPNERSSHSEPTPRGGGIAIVLVVLAALVLLAATGRIDTGLTLGLGGGGAMVAAVGWLDDRRGLSAFVRLLVHLAAAVWAVAWLGGMPHLTVGAEAVSLGVGGAVLAVLGVVWATNLYNFMDGIDGLAAAEAVVVGLLGAFLLAPREPSLASVVLFVGAAAGGFLLWNWPPARLFMGDVGSGFIGFLFGGLAVASENAGALPALLWLVLLGPFFVDATVTLLRRIAHGRRLDVAHRTHAYQRAVQAGWSHGRVTAAVVALSCGLGLLAALVALRPALLGPVLLTAGAALGAMYLTVERWRPMPRPEEGTERRPSRSTGEKAGRPVSSGAGPARGFGERG